MQNQVSVGTEKISIEETSICYLIEYYLVIDEDQINTETNAREWGIRVNKCTMEKECIETEYFKFISPSYEYVFNLANILKGNKVTPVSLQDVLTDIL